MKWATVALALAANEMGHWLPNRKQEVHQEEACEDQNLWVDHLDLRHLKWATGTDASDGGTGVTVTDSDC
jgi:hypothetical protein